MYAKAFCLRLFTAGLVTPALACALVAQPVPNSVALTPRLDEAAVLRIADMHITDVKGELEHPGARLREDGIWEASQIHVGHTNSGRCRRVNGCTVLHIRTVMVEDLTGRVIDRSKSKQVMANYE